MYPESGQSHSTRRCVAFRRNANILTHCRPQSRWDIAALLRRNLNVHTPPASCRGLKSFVFALRRRNAPCIHYGYQYIKRRSDSATSTQRAVWIGFYGWGTRKELNSIRVLKILKRILSRSNLEFTCVINKLWLRARLGHMPHLAPHVLSGHPRELYIVKLRTIVYI